MKYKNPVCKGSWTLGTACGHCERCQDTKKKQKRDDFETVMIPVTLGTRKKLIQMKLDLVDGGTYNDLMKRFIESEGY